MKNVKKDFPIFSRKIAGKPLIYFDNAATSQKPQQVIDRIAQFYAFQYATIYRGIYSLAEEATQMFQDARQRIANFIGADYEEVIFTGGTTHGINAIVFSWGMQHIHEGDHILLTEFEHHSNLIPWQQLAKKKKAILQFIPVTKDGYLEEDRLPELITKRTKIVAVSHVSNALGTEINLKPIIDRAHEVGAKVLIDAAQSAPHQKLNVHTMDPDFLVFSAHKMLGPTGLGVLYIKKEVQSEVPPYYFGGGMIYEADYEHATFEKPPRCYEAGTPPIAQVIGFGEAINYLEHNVDFSELRTYEAELTKKVIDGLQQIPEVTILGPIEQLRKVGHLVSFTVEGWHPHDVAAYLNEQGIAVRAGHYCAQPLAKKMGIDGSIRVSFYLYNTHEEVDYFLQVIRKLLV